MTTTSTFQQPANENGELQQNPQNLTASNFGNTESTPNGGHFLTMNVSFADEDSSVTQAHIETENTSSTTVDDEKSDAKLSTTNGDISVPTDSDKDKQGSSGIANGVTGDSITPSLVVEPHHDATVSNTAAKRKSFGVSY